MYLQTVVFWECVNILHNKCKLLKAISYLFFCFIYGTNAYSTIILRFYVFMITCKTFFFLHILNVIWISDPILDSFEASQPWQIIMKNLRKRFFQKIRLSNSINDFYSQNYGLFHLCPLLLFAMDMRLTLITIFICGKLNSQIPKTCDWHLWFIPIQVIYSVLRGTWIVGCIIWRKKVNIPDNCWAVLDNGSKMAVILKGEFSDPGIWI